MPEGFPGKPQMPPQILFLSGFLIGAFLFPLVYGTDLLQVTYDSWIFTLPDPDIKQHYLGFLHYAHSDWQFPPGLFDTLSYPHKMSIVWTDSIPGLCLIFKLLRSLLPKLFQFFGWFGLFSFALSGALSALLVRRLTKDTFLSLLYVPVMVLSFPVLQRLYYHTSLAAHWVILLALLIFFEEREWNLKRRCVVWGLMGALCVMIHSYFLPMTGIAMFTGEVVLHLLNHTPKRQILFPCAAFSAAGLLTLFLFGAFSVPVNHSGYAVGGFNANLGTFVNSLGDGLLPPFENKYGTQYEGFAYLGTGMILAALIAMILLFIRLILRRMAGKTFRNICMEHIYASACVVMILVYIIISVFPEADLGTLTLIPDFTPLKIKVLAGVFRSNGRLIWPAYYLIILSSAAVVKRLLPRAGIFVLLAACLLQLPDIYYFAAKKNAYFTEERFFMNPLDQIALNEVIGDYRHLVLVSGDNTLMMHAGDYAYQHGLTLNRFYFARDINGLVEDTLGEYKMKELPREDCLFFFRDGAEEGWRDSGLHFYEFGMEGIVLGSDRVIPSLPEI
ncbi:MAG: DUF6311 domain-containing protein [Lachnospiraceae bacterium]|nr:DUF6311 domain-containing protein [Lachnospiraceae bacterium]